MYSDKDCTGDNLLVAGSAYGLRRFALDREGVLRGVTYPYAWTEGVNTAQCLVAERNPDYSPHNGLIARQAAGDWEVGGYAFNGGVATPTLMEGWVARQCSGMDPACACGFYAYHSGQEAYAARLGCAVTGVIECTGKVILGSLGMRAEKARLVGIVLPVTAEVYEERRRVLRVIEETKAALDAHEPKGRAYVTNGTVVLGLGAIALALSGGFLGLAAGGACAVLAGYAEGVARLRNEERVATLHSHLAILQKRIDSMPRGMDAEIEAARKRYPSVMFADSYEELQEAYPVTSLKYLLGEPDAVRGEE